MHPGLEGALRRILAGRNVFGGLQAYAHAIHARGEIVLGFQLMVHLAGLGHAVGLIDGRRDSRLVLDQRRQFL